MTKIPTAIDLFCGVGGMSLGFEQAGFDVLAAFDSEEFNVRSHNINFPSSNSFKADLSRSDDSQLRKLARIGRKKIDVVFGGPPCQGFSVGGKRDLNDKRNLLVYDFARLVRQFQPSYFVMENVQGLMSEHSRPILDSFLRRIKNAGYRVVEPIKILNAADFGVPQRRKRTIIIGYRKGFTMPQYPDITADNNTRQTVVRDAIEDLETIQAHDVFFDCDVYEGILPEAKSKYAQTMRGLVSCPDDLSAPRDFQVNRLTGCLKSRHSSLTIRRFNTTEQGAVEPVSRYTRLSWEGVAPTLRAGTGTDRGSHTAPRPIHPSVPRCITTREAARLHSFPDWFQFHGTRWHDFRQIGNAVPPLLARAVAQKIAEVIP